MRIPGSEDPDLRPGSAEATRRLAFGPGHRLLDSDHERLGALRDLRQEDPLAETRQLALNEHEGDVHDRLGACAREAPVGDSFFHAAT